VSGAARNNVISEPTNENGKHGKRKRNTEDKFNKKSKTDTLNLKNRCLRCGNLSHKTEGCFTRDSKVKAFIAECKKANIKVPNETNNPRAERSGVSNYFCSANNATRMNYIRNTNNVHTDDHTMAFLRVDIQSNTKQPKFGQCFIDCGSSFDAISTKYAEKCGLTVTKYDSRPLKITLGGERKIEVPRCVAEMNINIQGVGAYRAHCFVLENIPENKDVLLGMPFLQHVNPEINWIDGSISAPQRSLEEVMAYHKVVEFVGSSGSTRVINPRQFEQLCKRNTDDGYLFSLQLKATEKVARQTDTGWNTLIDHPLYELLVKYKSSVFSETNPATESLQTKVEHSIDLKNKDPVSSRNYRLSNEQLKALEQWTKEMLAAGLIRPSTSPYSSPILVIRKPIGWRIVHDYRAINAVTNIPQSVIPRREAIVDAMVNSHWFTAMDLRSGYYQIPLRESDRHITAFSLPSGQYEYTVMAQGLSGAPATFNRIMQKIFAGMDTAKAFFDDIFVYTKSKDVAVHTKALEEVLEKLKLNNLRVKIEKCVFLADEIPVLGDFVGRTGVRMDPDKISIIRDWPIPKTKHEMKSFLGTVVYNQKFIKDYGVLVANLHDATKGTARKNAPINLTREQITNFEALKLAMANPPVLGIPDSN
jgi:predicted aspartyl protease